VEGQQVQQHTSPKRVVGGQHPHSAVDTIPLSPPHPAPFSPSVRSAPGAPRRCQSFGVGLSFCVCGAVGARLGSAQAVLSRLHAPGCLGNSGCNSGGHCFRLCLCDSIASLGGRELLQQASRRVD
jgi:hypothetical protein